MVQVKIRKMELRDLDCLAEIYTEVYDNFNVGEKWTKESSCKLIKYWFNLQPDLAFVAEFDDRLAGAFIASIKPWWDGDHLVDGEIFVHPDFQNKGVGTALSKAMFEKAIKKYNVVVWDTYTFKDYEFPLSWYKKLGFNEIKEWVMVSGNVKEALKRIRKK